MEHEELLDRLEGVQRYAGGANARCPAHADSRASLSSGPGEYGGVVFNCHAGCTPDQVLSALHLSWADVSPAPKIVAEYAYHDAAGNVLWTVERWVPKDFRCRPGLPPAGQRVLYARKWIDWARAHGQAVVVVEGEKDADNLHSRNIAATTNVGGAGKWLPQYSEELAGLHVLVVADNDDTGKHHARDVAAQLQGKAASVRLLKPRIGKDITEHLDAGLTLADLEAVEREGELVAYLGEDLRPSQIRWAWSGQIAQGAISFIDGDPGDGKSVLTCDLAARWSSGMPMPDGSANPLGGPVGVVMISAEDDPEMTISPRLRAHGADMSRVLCVVAGTRDDEPFSLASHLPALERLLVAHEAKVLILDPIMAFLGDTTDSSNDSSVRRALAPLAMMARRRGIAVIVVRHLNKGSGKAIYRGGGSIAFVGAARAAFLVSPHPDDENARVLAVVKNNLAPKGPALTYRLAIDPVYQVARVQWGGSLSTSAQELLDGGSSEERPSEVANYLRDLCHPTALAWKEIVAHGKNAGYTENAMRCVRHRVLEKVYGPGGNRDVVWGLRGLSAVAEPVAVPPPMPELDTSPLTDEDKDLQGALHASMELSRRPNVCDVCGGFGIKHGAPYWVVRCRAHDPKTYGGVAAR